MRDTSTSWLSGGATPLQTPQEQLDLIHLRARREAALDAALAHPSGPSLAARLEARVRHGLALVGVGMPRAATLDCCAA